MQNDADYEYDEEEDFGPSKTQIKKEMNALQALGEELVKLSPSQLATIPLGDRTRKEVQECHRLKSNGAIRRQKQLIGKLMRSEDAEAIQAALEAFDSSSETHTRLLHLVEGWRDKLVNDAGDALTEFIDAYPATDVQQLRQAIRLAKKDIDHQKNTGQMKKLFRQLKQYIEASEA